MFLNDVDQERVLQILNCETSDKIPKEVEEEYGRYQKAWGRSNQVGPLPLPILMNICVDAAPSYLTPKPLVLEIPTAAKETLESPVEFGAGHPVTYESPREGIMTGRFVEETKNGKYKVDFGEAGVRMIAKKNAHIPDLAPPSPNKAQVI